MCKTEQQTAASAGFSSVSTETLTDCTLFTEKRRQSRVQFVLWLLVQTCLCQVTNKFTLDVVFPWQTQSHTHDQCSDMCKGHCQDFSLPSYGEAVWTPMLCCLRSVCAVVAGVCLLLQQGLEEMLCGLHEKKNKSNDYWYSWWDLSLQGVSDEKKQSLVDLHWKSAKRAAFKTCKHIVIKTTA